MWENRQIQDVRKFLENAEFSEKPGNLEEVGNFGFINFEGKTKVATWGQIDLLDLKIDIPKSTISKMIKK